MAKPIRVLIVDDSALVRIVLSRGFARDKELEVVGIARDPYEARDLLVRLRPDVMTLDIEMPHMDGIDFLRKFMAVLPTPTVVLSSLAVDKSVVAQQALAEGAVYVLAKPKVSIESGLDAAMAALITHVKRAASQRVLKRDSPQEADAPQPRSLDVTTDLVIGIGASTGGVAALGRIVPMLPAWTPGVVMVQHIAEGFTEGFAKRLDALFPMEVVEARDGDRVLRGRVLVAPGGVRHLEIHRAGGEYRVRLRAGPPVSGHTPSVDVLFNSLASHAGKNALGCLLTGMGSDGAQGLLELRRAGGRTVIQSQATCAVWGMPAAAQALGAAEQTRGLLEVPAALMEWARPRGATGS